MTDIADDLRRLVGAERSKAQAAETPFQAGLCDARANTLERAAARIAELEAEVARLQSVMDAAAAAWNPRYMAAIERAEAAEADGARLREYYNAAEAIETINAERERRKADGLLCSPNIFALTYGLRAAETRLTAARAAIVTKP